jgi:outer membrane receptor protein involved in Fe transport
LRFFKICHFFMQQSVLSSAGLLTALILSSPAFANQLEEVVVTASRSEQNIVDVAANISTIADLEAIGSTHINEAMQRSPGVWISRGNGQESLIALRSPVLTGAGGCGAFLTAEDGIPLRASGFCNVNQLFDVNSEQAERIEVLKGPGSVWYGSNAMHGMINIISPMPNNRQSFSLEAGPHDYYRTRISASGEDWRVSTNLTSDGGYKHDSGFDQQKINLKRTGSLGEFSSVASFSFSNLNQETAGFIRGNRAYEDRSAGRQNPNPEAYRDTQAMRGYLRLNRTLSSGAELTLTPYFRATDMAFIQHFLPGQAIEENAHQSLGLQSAWQSERLTVGLDVELTSAELEEFQPNATTGSAFLVGTIPQGQHYDYEVDASTIALFAHYEYPLGDQTTLEVGARAERVSYDYDNLMLSGNTRDDGTPCGFGGCRFSRPDDRDDDFSNVSPQLSVLHNFNSDHQTYLRLARGYRAPQATELYRLQGGQVVSNIDPEELDSFEVGFRGQLERLSYNAAIFAMNKDNFIFRDSNRNTVDNGKTSHRGLELQLGYRWSERWRADLVANYARHQYENNPDLSASPISGNDIDTAPRTSGSARLNWQPNSQFKAELEWVYLGSYYTDPLNTAKYPGHRLLNLRIDYSISDGVSLHARLMNLADEKYAERADFAFGSDRYFVGEPASIYLGVTSQF